MNWKQSFIASQLVQTSLLLMQKPHKANLCSFSYFPSGMSTSSAEGERRSRKEKDEPHAYDEQRGSHLEKEMFLMISLHVSPEVVHESEKLSFHCSQRKRHFPKIFVDKAFEDDEA